MIVYYNETDIVDDYDNDIYYWYEKCYVLRDEMVGRNIYELKAK